MIKTTPMMQQYLEIKAQYADALLLYRMGDFYELFMDDAVTAAQILEITLTSRDKQAEIPVPMCGVPYHAAEGYIAKLVSAGHKVAVCDQVEDPRKAKGLVRREVTRVITPGLILENSNLVAKEPNYLAAIISADRSSQFGLAYLDISTAEFKAVELDSQQVIEEMLRVSPKELLLPQDMDNSFLKHLPGSLNIALTELDPVDFDGRRAEERLLRHFKVHSLEGFGIHDMELSVRAAGAILAYVEVNLLGACSHINRLLPYNRADFMILDEATVRNLDIFESTSFQGRKGTLLDVLDLTQTAMGGRKLQQWLRYPLLDLTRIELRQEAVSDLVEKSMIRTSMREHLGKISDIERLNGRNSTGTSNPRDIVALKRSLQVLPLLRETLAQCAGGQSLTELVNSWDDLTDVAEVIERTLTDPPPVNASSGGIIRHGVHAALDHYVRLSRDARSWMADYEAAERRQTGISSLKVRFNKVFGYYIEVSNANQALVPPHYIRKQTLVNAERFITEELKTFETQVLEADEKRLLIEQEVFGELRKTVAAESERIQRMAQRISELDCLASLSEVAARNDYCRPHINQSDSIHIREGRHPVIEHFLQHGTFVPNDLDMDQENQQVLIITGPNMAGKSTILRQAALIVLMAQIGSFVPASESEMGLVDRIFTRVGASDDLARGRSTFMVEMQEAANILHQATPRSLIILDEIGRGTSTFDGMSIAWAVAEHLHSLGGEGVKTLFATHYHELTELTRSFPRVKNFNVAVKEWQHDIVFFHKLVPGGTNRSYGIQVAKLAGLPGEVIERARELLAYLENGEAPFSSRSTLTRKKGRSTRDSETGVQLTLFRPSLEWLKDRILGLDLDRVTPLAALQTLFALKEQIRGGSGGGEQRIKACDLSLSEGKK